MGLFSSKSKSTSTTKNESTTVAQTLGDLSTGNIQTTGDLTINGLWGEDMQAFLEASQSIVDKATSAANDASVTTSNLAGNAIAEVAKSYQSAYSESTGIIQQLKPVLLAGVAAFAIFYAYKMR